MEIYFRFFIGFLALPACFFSTEAQPQVAQEICYNPNLVKDTSKKSIKSIAVGVINATLN